MRYALSRLSDALAFLSEHDDDYPFTDLVDTS